VQQSIQKTISMQNETQSLSKSTYQMAKEGKRVVVGNGMYDETSVILLTIITPGKPHIAYMMPKEQDDNMDLFDMLGDKVNELEAEGFSVEYRLDEDPIIISTNK
tara:strand:- start:242 stop:556 length:315 start_codon:yes stop_codon:yes gene_type:complete